MKHRTTASLLAFSALAGAAWAQAPVGPEFRVNTYTTADQLGAAAAISASGNFVVVWESDTQDGSQPGIFGQRFDASGARLGGEFAVNTYTTGRQALPAVASDPTGNFVVVWGSLGQKGGPYINYGVFGQRFGADGERRGGEFRVNTTTTTDQWFPAIASMPGGGYVVVWLSQQAGHRGLFGQRLAATGAPVGVEFEVNTVTNLPGPEDPSVAADASGNFVVVWHSLYQDGDDYGVFAQRLSSAGVRLGGPFQVNTYTTGAQASPAAAMDADGNFVVVWDTFGQDTATSYGIYGQRFRSTGARSGGEFRVNTIVYGNQFTPSAAYGDGRFVVTWTDRTLDGDQRGVFGQRFTAAGTLVGAQFQVNTTFLFDQNGSFVAPGPAGAFVVSWRSKNQDGSEYGVFAQRFACLAIGIDPPAIPSGVVGSPYTVTFTRSGGAGPGTFRLTGTLPPGLAFAAGVLSGTPAAAGVFPLTVTASDANQCEGLRAFDLTVGQPGAVGPLGLAADVGGNGVLEAGETDVIAPSWFNGTSAAVTLTGTASNFSGPPGPTYTLVDSGASYGTVASRAAASCTGTGNCYVVSVAGARPSVHWDSSLVETTSAGGQKAWTLHVGESFADVPVANSFYRFVETLLHAGVTGGCASGRYCPSDAATREQMAVFVLVAKEGAGYAPPACVIPMFGDVPPSSPFCRFIEELSRRGVVTGCGAPNYCPHDPVTREQMAVFVLRTLDPALDPPACDRPLFGDVPSGSGFCRWIEELARRGVVGGCGGGDYCPRGPVTREQMGVFLALSFRLTLYGL